MNVRDEYFYDKALLAHKAANALNEFINIVQRYEEDDPTVSYDDLVRAEDAAQEACDGFQNS